MKNTALPGRHIELTALCLAAIAVAVIALGSAPSIAAAATQDKGAAIGDNQSSQTVGLNGLFKAML
ncbi:hypothetical protein GN109_06100 [Collimonas pratensis]|uniref:hypothetical protein n=1 Tax=Collimonas pratensis TaxID=279113 RepID=UPI00143DFEF1|nr:hypothetical protein [Collimonas pratensis]NKI68986.1 hypothetical protein [Collimonas pratensis]